MYSIRYHRLFAIELARISAWYSRKQDGLGGEFIETVNGAINELVEKPRRGKRVADNVYRLLTKRFPYAVYYRLHDNSIGVIGVRHLHRKPLKRFRVG